MIVSKVNSLKLNHPSYPQNLKNIHSPPQTLYWAGEDPRSWLDNPKVAIVGSRKISQYGRVVTGKISAELASLGVVIISGLAYGVDLEAHKAALKARGITVAVLPTSLEKIYPSYHSNLAREIISSGGSIISEYFSGSRIYKSNFIVRNRIVSGLADVLLITEAAVNSGSLHTARFALEQGKTVMAVPGNINSQTSQGCNNLIKSGAVPATSTDDVLFALNLKVKQPASRRPFQGSAEEQTLMNLIGEGLSDQEELSIASRLDGQTVSSTLTMLEIGGHIRSAGGGRWIPA